jgi:hypothetical protein
VNSSGKEKIAKIKGHTHYNKSCDKLESSYQFKMEVTSATSTDETKMEFTSGNADDVHKNAARTSCRLKRTPITRNEGFLWATHTSKTV